jgi:hypothetical protein
VTTPPVIYAEWVVLLERFGSGEDEVVAIMQQGTIAWTNVVAERWTHQIANAFQSRLRSLSGQLQTAFDRARDIDGIANAMLLARRGLGPLQLFIGIEAIREDIRANLSAELNGWATGTQEALERHAEALRHRDYGHLLKTFRDHPLSAGIAAQEVAPASPATVEANAASRRRIILS